MGDYQWQSYGIGITAPGWIRDLQCDQRIKNRLSREASRIGWLVQRGTYDDRSPIPPSAMDALKNDLELWWKPAAVLSLLENDPGLLGPKTRIQAMEAIKAYIASNPTAG